VLTGVDRPSDLLRTTLSPKYVIGALSDLLEPYAAPSRTDAGWVCGGARARLDGDGLELDATETVAAGGEAPADPADPADGTEPAGGSPMDGVRAGLAALLEARDAGEQQERLVQLASTLDDLLESAG
jgi:hypothetical protein